MYQSSTYLMYRFSNRAKIKHTVIIGNKNKYSDKKIRYFK